MRKLQALGEIECRYSGLGSDIPYFIKVLPDGELHNYRHSQQIAAFWKGFLAGVASAVVSTIVAQLIVSLLI